MRSVKRRKNSMVDDTINLYLDDVRGIPNEKGLWNDYKTISSDPKDGIVWLVVRTVNDCVEALKTQRVAILSLDHDLGETDPKHTGYDILLWLEEQIALHENMDVIPDDIYIHSRNTAAYGKMLAAVDSIMKKRKALQDQRRKNRDFRNCRNKEGEAS